MSSPREGDDRPAGGSEREDGTERADVPAGEPRFELHFHMEETDQLGPAVADEGVTMDAESVVELPDDTFLVYWRASGVDARPFLAALEELPTTLDVRLLSSVGGRHRVEVHAPSDSLNSIVREFDGIVRSLAIDEEGASLVVEFPPDVDAPAVVRSVRERYPELELVAGRRIVTPGVVRRVVSEGLTTRQLTALRLAYYGGYFERPRLSTGEELADRMGISKQTFHEHLRKAHATVFETLFEHDGGHRGT